MRILHRASPCWSCMTKLLLRCFCKRCAILLCTCALAVWIYLFEYRYYRAIYRYPSCRTVPSAKLAFKADNLDSDDDPRPLPPPEVIKNLEKIKNVTVFYRNQLSQSRCSLVDGRRILISYASECCERSQVINCDSGLQVGGFDMCLLFGPESIDERFRMLHIDPLMAISSRGGGYWAWKPYIILKTLLEMDDNDVLFYADSGSEFIANVDLGLICLQAQLKKDVVLFELTMVERSWTKADAFVLTGCLNSSCTDTNQLLASFILLRKSFFSIQFVSSWLTYATDPRAISDLPSTLVANESPHFIDHRHDQSLLSLVAKKWGLAKDAWADPSQYGDETRQEKAEQHRFINRRYIIHTRVKS